MKNLEKSVQIMSTNFSLTFLKYVCCFRILIFISLLEYREIGSQVPGFSEFAFELNS
jgi:hypothetical protein